MIEVRVHRVILSSPNDAVSWSLGILDSMSDYKKLVAEAKRRLKNASRDVAHDLQHHERVWKVCQEIVKSENLSLNTSLLKISVYWHDVVVGEEKWPSILMVRETCDVLKKLMRENKFKPSESKIVIEAVLYHEFRNTPKSVEGLVLQDADKLEALSEERWSQTLQAYRNGAMTSERLASYATTFLKWIPIISATFHYSYSRKTANERIAAFWDDAQWQQVIDELGLENQYLNSKKSINSFRSQFFCYFLMTKNIVLKMKIKLFATIF